MQNGVRGNRALTLFVVSCHFFKFFRGDLIAKRFANRFTGSILDGGRFTYVFDVSVIRYIFFDKSIHTLIDICLFLGTRKYRQRRH